MRREWLLRASLAANGVLLALTALVFTRSQNGISDRARPRATPPAHEARPHEGASLPHFSSDSNRIQWVIEQLRTAGLPNAVLARVALADWEEHWQKRFEEGGDADSMSARQLEQDLSRDAALRAALGEKDFLAWDKAAMLREAVSGKIELSGDETDKIYALKKSLQQRQRELEQARVSGTMDDREIDRASEKALTDFNEQMSTLLGSQRYAQSQGLDEATAAANLRRDLARAAPTELQVQQLLQTHEQLAARRAELDEQFRNDPSSPRYADQLHELDRVRDQEYERVLGPDAFDQLQKSQDLRYSKMKKYETTWGLDDHSVDHVYGAVRYCDEVVEDYRGQARALEAQGQPVDWSAVEKTVAQFRRQTEAALQAYLGPERFAKLQQNGIVELGPTPLPDGRLH
jgi:hypothetical protein